MSHFILIEKVNDQFKAQSIHTSRESAEKSMMSFIDFYTKVLKADIIENKYPNSIKMSWKNDIVMLELKEDDIERQ